MLRMEMRIASAPYIEEAGLTQDLASLEFPGCTCDDTFCSENGKLQY